MKLNILWILTCCWLLISCNDQSEHPLVKVGDQSLKLKEFESRFPPEVYQSMSHAQKLEYLSRWINREVLFQEGTEVGLLDDPDIQRQMDDFKRKIVSERYLDMIIAQLPQPTESQLEIHYQNNTGKYLRTQDQWDYKVILVKSGQQAWKLFEALKSANFNSSLTWINKSDAYKVKTYQRHRPTGDCTLKSISDLPLKRISMPKKCGGQYALIYVEKRYSAGEVLKYSEVQDRVRVDYLAKRSLAKRKEILDQSIQKTPIILDQAQIKQ